jgi:hypothetical protein
MSASVMASVRAPHFKEDEVKTLLDCVAANRRVLFGSFSKEITKERKEEVWQEIATKMNSTSATKRSVKHLKKKWSDFSSRAKVKRLKIKKQKSGENQKLKDLTECEQLALEIIGETAVEGIEGGIDSLDDMMVNLNENHDIDDDEDTLSLNEDNVVRPDEVVGTSTPSTEVFPVSTSAKSNSKKSLSASEQLLLVEREKLDLMKERLLLTKQTLDVQMKIAFHLERIESTLENGNNHNYE